MVACPICDSRVSILVLHSHVNQCLDRQERVEVDIPSPPRSDSETDVADISHPRESHPSQRNRLSDTRIAPELKPDPKLEPKSEPQPKPQPKLEVVNVELKPEPREQAVSSHHQTPIAAWLTRLGLSKYTPHFVRAGFRTLSDVLTTPSPADALREHGILALGARRKLISEIRALKGQPATESSALSLMPTPASTSPAISSREKVSVWARFLPGAVTVTKRPAPTPAIPTPKRPRHTNGRPYPANGRPAAGSRRQHRISQRVPGTPFTVDSFQAARHDEPGSIYFLTHFHADHYGGLRRTTLPRGARVVCSAVTARLVRSELSVPYEFLTVVPLAQKVSFGNENGADVWFFDANHCPGAVVILFYVRKTKRWVLHSGDCRYDRAVFHQHGKLVEIVQSGQLDYLHLDTTYCNPKYVFPAQPKVLASVVEAARQEDCRTRKRCLYFFGTYSIGKEKVFVAVAEALNLRIYTGKRKRSILEKLDMAGVKDRLVDRPSEARVHVVSMRALSADGLREYAVRNGLNKDFIGRGLAIVFRPTGWTYRPNNAGYSKSNRSADQAMVYEVAYSEHSSYDELTAFVRWAKPARLVPTVNARSKEQADELRSLLGHADRSMRAVT